MKKGWEAYKLGEISKLNYGYTEKAVYKDVGPKFLRITDIQENNVDWASVPYCKIENTEVPKYILKNGDIVFARTGATTGKSYLIKNPPASIFASYLIRLQILDLKRLLPEFLIKFFSTKVYWDTINAGVSGSAQGGFNATKLGELEIPLPPLPEQKRIVAVLDESFAALAIAKENAEKNLENARELFESYLKEMFENKGDGWDVKTLGDIGKVSMCKRIFKEETKTKGAIPFFKIGTFGKEPNAFISQVIYNEYRNKYSFPKKGDILISASGTIGRCVKYDGEPAYFQDSNIVWIDNNEKQILNAYLYKFYVICKWQSTKGATISRLYNDNLKQIEIAFPKSIEQQQTIVYQFDALQAETKKLEAIFQQKLSDLEELKKSLLQKAFNGEL